MIEIHLSACRVFTDLKYMFFSLIELNSTSPLIYISHHQDQQTIKYLSTNLSGDIILRNISPNIYVIGIIYLGHAK